MTHYQRTAWNKKVIRRTPASLLCLMAGLVFSAGTARWTTAHASGHMVTSRTVYAAMGDGFSSEGGCSGVPTSKAFPALLARHLAHGSRYLNSAAPGADLSLALATQLSTVIAAHPTLITWFAADPTTPASYRSDLDTLLTRLQRTRARVFIGTLPDLRLFHDAGSRSQAKEGVALNRIIASEATRHGAIVVDVYSHSKAIWGQPGMFVNGCFDAPSARGESKIASLFYRVMHRHGAL